MADAVVSAQAAEMALTHTKLPHGTPLGHAWTWALTRSRPNGEMCWARTWKSSASSDEPQGCTSVELPAAAQLLGADDAPPAASVAVEDVGTLIVFFPGVLGADDDVGKAVAVDVPGRGDGASEVRLILGALSGPRRARREPRCRALVHVGTAGP